MTSGPSVEGATVTQRPPSPKGISITTLNPTLSRQNAMAVSESLTKIGAAPKRIIMACSLGSAHELSGTAKRRDPQPAESLALVALLVRSRADLLPSDVTDGQHRSPAARREPDFARRRLLP